MSSSRRLLFQLNDSGISLFTDFGAQNTTFRDALIVRSEIGFLGSPGVQTKNRETEFDHYSHHYVLYRHMKPVGTVTVTCVLDGVIDCHEYYPQQLLEQLRHVTASASHFRIRDNETCSYQILRRVIREVWIHRLALGTRLNIVNVTTERLKGYRAMGYYRLPVPVFVHPRLKTESHTLVLAADPTVKSFIQDYSREIDNPLSLQSVLNLVSQPAFA